MANGFNRAEAERTLAAVLQARNEGFSDNPAWRQKGVFARAGEILGVNANTVRSRMKPGGACAAEGVFLPEKASKPEPDFKGYFTATKEKVVDPPPSLETPLPAATDDEELSPERQAELGLLGTRPVLPGFILKTTSTQRDADGATEREWVRQVKDHGERFSVPSGHRIKGVSALVDAEGREIQKWIKTAEEKADAFIDAIKTVFDEYKGRAQPTPAPKHFDSEILTLYPISDVHLGMYAWQAETGEAYDLKIAEKLLLDTMSTLVASAPAAKTAIVLGLGDFAHADNSSNQTARSGHVLDVDTRYAKVLQTGVRMAVQCIELALQKHERVIVRFLQGNHDEHFALAITAAMYSFFHNEPRVEVDCSPNLFFKHVFGSVMLAATHGHCVKPDRMPGVAAAMWAKEWGATNWRYAWFGHVHHKSRGGSADGMVWETTEVLAAKDAYHHANGYTSGRSMMAVTYHEKLGELLRHTVSIKPSAEAA